MIKAHVTELIISGDYDADLNKLSEAIKMRKDLLRSQAEANMKLHLVPGETRVRFIASARPKYLAGREATVTKIAQKKIHVKVDAGDIWEKGTYLGKTIITPMSLVEVI